MRPAAMNRGRAGLALSALLGIVWGAGAAAGAPRQVPGKTLACGGSTLVMGVALADTVEVDTGVAYGRVAMPDSIYWGQRFAVLRATNALPADTVVLAHWQGSVENLSLLFRARGSNRRMAPGDTFIVHPVLRDPEHWAAGLPTLDVMRPAFPDLADDRAAEAAARGTLMSVEEAYDFCSLPVDQEVVNSGDWSAPLEPMDWAKASNGAWQKHPAQAYLRGLAHSIERARVGRLPMDIAGTWSASVSLPSGRTFAFYFRTADLADGFPYQPSSPEDEPPWAFRASGYQVRMWAATSLADLPEIQAVDSPLPLCRFFMEFVPVPPRDESCLGFRMFWDVSVPTAPGEPRSGMWPGQLLDEVLLGLLRDNEFNGLLFGEAGRLVCCAQGRFQGAEDALEFHQEVTLAPDRVIRFVARRVSQETVVWRLPY